MDEKFKKYFLMEIEDLKKSVLSIDGNVFFDQTIKNLNWFRLRFLFSRRCRLNFRRGGRGRCYRVLFLGQKSAHQPLEK